MTTDRHRLDLGAMLVVLVALNVLTIVVLDGIPAAILQMTTALATVAIALRRGYSADDLGLSRRAALDGLRLGGVLSAVVVAGVVAIAVTPVGRDALDDERFADLSLWEAAAEVLIRIPIVTAMSEELLFRSVLLAVLMAIASTRWAVVLSSLVFGCWHVLVALDDLGENAVTDSLDTTGRIGGVVGIVAATGAAGVVFAWTRLRSGSVAAPWLLHAVLNGTTFTAGYVLAST